MWVGTKLAAQLAVVGAGLVVASLHSGSGSGGPVTPAAAAYTPPVAPVVAPVAQPKVLSAPARPKPATKARTAARHHVAPTRTVQHASKPAVAPRRPATRHVVKPAAAPTTYRSALMAAVARIPTYRAGAARWVVSRAYAFWGTADWYHDVLYVSPDVPRSKLYDVAVHEWSHELSVLDYSGDVAAATRAMNAWFGGSGLTGPERAADCMAILQGATWTHYTTCTNSHWRSGARLLVSGKRL